VPGAQNPSFAVIGEAVIDLVDPGDGSACLARPGGSPLNVAVGLARLGNPAAFVGRLSGDPLGTVLRRHLERSGVDLSAVVLAREPSTIALVELSGGQASYQFSAAGTADFQWSDAEVSVLPGSAAAVHFGSLGSWLPPGDEAVNRRMAELRARGSVLLSYDPNARPTLQGQAGAARVKVQRSAALAHVIKASAEDVDWLYGVSGPAGRAAVAAGWLDLGASLVVVTAGADGATAWTRGLPPVTRPADPAPPVDTVGAGDAFMSGLLDALARRALLSPDSLAALRDAGTVGAILDDASVVAAITCSRPGADPPCRAEVERFRAGVPSRPA
jgi:fructokinase